MRKNGVFWGIMLIVAALYIVLRALGLVADVPVWTILFTLAFGAMFVRGVARLEWVEIFMSLALLGCVYLDELNALIASINPEAGELSVWVLLVAGFLMSCGFSMIFKKRHVGVNVEISGNDNPSVENFQDGSVVRITNNFNGKSKYVNTQYLEKAIIENNFGQCNVYFENARIAHTEAMIEVENNFGETNLHLPKAWRVEMADGGVFSDVKIYGVANSDMDAPVARIKVSANFGQVNIHIQ